MTRIYISGPMRGYPRFNYDAFDDLAAQLRSSGYDVISPADRDREMYPDIEKWDGFATGDLAALSSNGFHLEDMLAWDLAQVIDADEFVLLPGWEDSTGAGHERYVAEVTGTPIWLALMGTDYVWHLDWDEEQRRVSAAHKPTSVVEGDWKDGELQVRVGEYVTKDSGKRVDYASGMRRDTDEGKPRYDLIPVMPIRRLAELYARGAVKYGDNNWQLADSPEEALRFRASAERHFMQWKAGDTDEDHPIAVMWNIIAALVTEEKLGLWGGLDL